MASALTVEVRSRHLWLLRVAIVLVRLPLPLRVRRAIVVSCWERVQFEYRCGGAWQRMSKPELELDQ